MKRVTQFSLTTFVMTSLIASFGLVGCEKKTASPATTTTASASSTTSVSSTTAATSTPSITTIAQSAATATVLLPASPAVSASASTPAPAVKPASTTQTTTTRNNLITQPTVAGTPEDVLKKSVNALVNGNAKEAASYYHIEGVNMAQVLAEQQPTFQKQLKHLELSPTEYNADKTQAGIFGNLTLANSPTPKQTLYKFQKINRQWKIVG